jgi:predicted AAA+ superfamily ATPase
VVATGSSTLQASAKFRDTLTGRKYQVWLTPMISEDLVDFGAADLNHRLQFGGLPPFFLSPEVPRKGFEEWMDSYWARDIQELFRVEKKVGFERLLELLLVQSGGMFEATSFTTPCELARATVVNYLGVLEETRIVHVIRPYATHRAAEIVSTPKVYGFDTAFVCHYRGWDTLRPEDLGYLWEHYVLNEIHGRSQRQDVRYWRDKDGHEIDFVLARPGRPPLAIECKWSVAGFETRNLRSFRRRYPEGENWIVCANVTRPFGRHDHDLMLEFMGIDELARRVQAP